MVKVQLANGRGVALVDDEDADRVLSFRWCRCGPGYVGHRADGKVVSLHRFIVGLAPGDGREVDHINGDRLDNRRENLRIVTRAQNNQNTPARGGSSAHRGVSFCKQTGRWRATAGLNGKLHHIGRFDTEAEAAEAAWAWRAENMPFATRR